MVRTVIDHGDRLRESYRWPWSEQSETIGRFLDKQAIEQRCRDTGLEYPATRYLRDASEIRSATADWSFPLIVKPARPLSRFKVRLVESADELARLGDQFPDSLPYLLQQWVPGGDDRIAFGALYLDRGKVVARFEGRKIRSHPPAMGQTTCARSFRDDGVHEATRSFFEELDLSGPVSLELKRAEDGGLWAIEPTVGRTDFWLDCCVANGVDFPWLAYLGATGRALPDMHQRDIHVWYDTNKDPIIALRAIRATHGAVLARRPRFAFVHPHDPGPAIRASWRNARRLAGALTPHRETAGPAR